MMELFHQGLLLQVVAALYLAGFAFFAVSLSIADIRWHRLPNRLVLAWALYSVALLLGVSLLRSDYQALLWALLASLILGGGYLLLSICGGGAMGMGDVKLAAVLGLNLGYFSLGSVLFATIVAFISASLLVLIGMLLRRLTLRSRVPFGPFMIFGAGLALFMTT